MDVDLEKNISGISQSPTISQKKNDEIVMDLDSEEDNEKQTQSPFVSKARGIKHDGPEAYAAVVAELKAVIVEAKRREGDSKNEMKVGNEEKSTIISPTKTTTFPAPTSPNKIGQAGKKSSILRKPSEITRNKINQEVNFTGFEKLTQLKSISMSLDWINFKIKDENGGELFQAVQSRYCSLSVTGRNELFLRKPNAENVLRINSSAEEDLRNFNIFTANDKHVGTASCNVRQTFKVPSTLKNMISGRTYNVSVQHEEEGVSKFWQIDDALEETTVASIKVQVGHRWKSVYTLTFIKETSTSSQILLVGLLLALASARLESEIVPAFFAIFGVLLTFLIFFILNFT